MYRRRYPPLEPVETPTQAELIPMEAKISPKGIQMWLNTATRKGESQPLSGKTKGHIRGLTHILFDRAMFPTAIRRKVHAAGKACGIESLLKGERTKFSGTLIDHWLGTTNAPVAVIKDLMRQADIRTTFNEYGNGLPAPMCEANSKVVRMVLRQVDGIDSSNPLNLKRIFGVGSGGRTHDIQSHSLAFCH
jgi:hypothetical protein